MTPVNKNKIAMVEDHRLFRKQVCTLIAKHTPFEIAIEAANGIDFTTKFSQLPPENRPAIALVDANMPAMDGYETVRWIRQNAPEIKVMVLTLNETEISIIRMINLGVAAYLKKSIDAPELFEAIAAVAKNGHYYNDYLPKEAHTVPNPPIATIWYTLTQEERQIARDLCSEMPYADIAKQMKITLRTFEILCKSVFDKFQVSTRISLIMLVSKYSLP